jgi:hypothetical protein
MKHLKRIIVITIIIGLFSLYFVLGNHKAVSINEIDKITYDSTGFQESSDLSNTNKLIASNDTFELYFDETTSYFKVVDLRTMEVYESNPSIEDPWVSDLDHSITTTAIEKQKSTLEVQYYNESGSLTTINNYKYSIYHPETILDDEGIRTFSIKYIDQGVQIKYLIEDLEIDYLYFPKYLPQEEFEAMEDFSYLKSLAYTGFDEETGLYEILDYEDMSKPVRKRLYDIFYGKLDYTREQAIAENESYGYFEDFDKVKFEIAIQIQLTDKGITTAIIHDSIVESEVAKISQITLYPLFGTAISTIDNQPSEGYLVLPDGSGAVIEFNNGKYFQNAYNKRLYGQDLSLLPTEMAEQQEKIAIPVYGMVKENGGFAAIISQGDAMASIQADVSGRIDSYNKIYTTFKLREVESVVIGSGYNQYAVDLWTDDIVNTDFEVTYVFLDNNENSYVGIANVYKDYLIESYDFEAIDDTQSTVLTTEFIGAYDRQEFFLGVPYNTIESMTTFDEAEFILEEIKSMGITSINVIYQGMMNGGLTQSINDKVKIEKVLGGVSGYEDFTTYLTENDMNIYQSLNLMTAESYDKAFDQFRYTAQRLNGKNAVNYNYHYPSGLPYEETDFDHSPGNYVINPAYYDAIYQSFNEDYKFDAVAFYGLGSMLAGNYSNNHYIYVQDSIRYQETLLNEIDQNIMLNNPLGFAISYADYITDLPTEATLYSIIDYQIPLLQLVLSGFVDYSGQSINLASDRSIDYQFLKAIETGSNLKYTLSFDDSIELLNTEYNYYMATKYSNWLETIDEQITELDELNLHQGYLVNHEIIGQNIVKVTYSNNLVILINYNLFDVTVNTLEIPSMDYIVLEVAA